MISLVIFVVVVALPLIIHFVNSGVAAKERRGIAAGIPKPKRSRSERGPTNISKARPARVRPVRTEYCGRGFTHFALAIVGSQEACKYCRYLQEAPDIEAADEPAPPRALHAVPVEPVEPVEPAEEEPPERIAPE